jgi:subtilisin family serine protease
MLAAIGVAAVTLASGAAPALQPSRPPAALTLAGNPVEVVVALHRPPLARAFAQGRAFQSLATRRGHLDVRAPAARAYTRALAAEQRTLAARIVRELPGAKVRWRYQVVLDALAVVVPKGQVARLARVPGVARVYPSVTYRRLASASPATIGAPQVWGPNLETAGQGVKIGIVDDGVDAQHPYFSPAGLKMPAGFPRGQRAYTNAKVIVARSFAPPSPRWKYATKPFDPQFSEHGTHVAGIAAGDHGTRADRVPGRGAVAGLSGVAPLAYLGNYRVLTIPTSSGVGLDGNTAEITAGIEAAVRDGMDVINLSLGEPETNPKRDAVVAAIDAAADAGVVPVVAAGNDGDVFGRGSVDSPGSAAEAITAAAVTEGRDVADFSSVGPTPMSLRMKPDVSAPGVDVTSSVPQHEGTWASYSGTSMAAPHVAGAAALLRQRHPAWTVEQVKSALVQTASPALAGGGREAPATREGGGIVNVPRADNPLVFADPTGLSFGLVRAGTAVTRTVALTDAGGGAGPWTVSLVRQTTAAGVTISAPATAQVPGSLPIRVTAANDAQQRDLTGFVVLRRGADSRRIPYWLRAERPQLGLERHGVLRRTGTYRATTRGAPSRVGSYRYPDAPSGMALATDLGGPERVFRVTLRRPAANFGVAVLSTVRGVRVEPRIVAAGDENRVQGFESLPYTSNPYLSSFDVARPVVATLLPDKGSYDVVFDTPTGARPGAFTFRFWVGDTTAPRVRLLTRTIPAGAALRLAVTDAGSGVDAETLFAAVDGTARTVRWRAGRATLAPGVLAPGRHKLVVVASDLQELKNDENVARILPNTRVLRTTFVVR